MEQVRLEETDQSRSEKVTALIGLMIAENPEVELTILGPPSFGSQELADVFVASKNLTSLIGKTSLSDITE